MNGAKWPGQKQAKPVRILPEEHFRQQFTNRIKQKNEHRKNSDAQQSMAAKPFPEEQDDKTDDRKIGDGVADENCPKKILGSFHVAMQNFGARISSSFQLADAQRIQRQDARFHS